MRVPLGLAAAAAAVAVARAEFSPVYRHWATGEQRLTVGLMSLGDMIHWRPVPRVVEQIRRASPGRGVDVVLLVDAATREAASAFAAAEPDVKVRVLSDLDPHARSLLESVP